MRGLRSDPPVTQEPAQVGHGQAGGGQRSHARLLAAITVALPVLAELIVGGYRIGGPSLWRDEAATISGAQRPLAAIWAMMRNEDAVHGPYYLLMHPVMMAGGISATTLRLPSLIAMSIAVGLTVVLGRRLALASALPAPAMTAMIAGLLLVAVPLTTRYAQEARPYALTTLFVVLASYLLVRAVGSPRWPWWALYAAALLLAGLFNLFAVLIAAAHGISLLAARRAGTGTEASGRAGGEVTTVVLRRWLAACAAAAVLLSPVIVFSAGQSAQLNWVKSPSPSAVASLVRDFAGATALIIVVAGLALVGCFAGKGLRDRSGLTLAWLTVPWLMLPPVVLIALSFIQPVYVERYVLFCLPALSLLASAGLAWLAVLIRRALAGRELGDRSAELLAIAPSAVLAAAIVLALISPQREVRLTPARADDLRAVAAVIGKRELPGDAILYLPWNTELVGVAYPAPFGKLRDIGSGASPIVSATLRGLPAGPGVVAARLRGVARVWTVQWAKPLTPGSAAPVGLTGLLSRMRMIGRWQVQSVVLRLYVAG